MYIYSNNSNILFYSKYQKKWYLLIFLSFLKLQQLEDFEYQGMKNLMSLYMNR